MPLFSYSGPQAVAMRKSNPNGGWGNRSGLNRVEPIAAPGFETPFTLHPGDKIFTVGSCFARHVETALLKRGFQIPLRELFKRKEFMGLDPGVVNNFGSPSIYNELSWALGEQQFNAADHIVEVQPGKYVDMHVIPSIRPADRETVMRRRSAITKAYKSIKNCRLVIATLGLVEVWYDCRTGYYLNASPRPSMLRSEPERYQFHVLSFDEVYAYLAKALGLIKSHGHRDVRVVLTVSPIPLSSTHRDDDVIVANCYSKSVLRAAAETARAEFDFVTYFPSYESVTLSDRKQAWNDDLVHVTREIVSFNINRMVDAYAPSKKTLDDRIALIEAGGAATAREQAGEVIHGSSHEADAFFAHFADLVVSDADLALINGQYLIDEGRPLEALDLLSRITLSDHRLSLQQAQAQLVASNPGAALDIARQLATKGIRSTALWKIYFNAAKATDDADEVLCALNWWTQAVPRRAGRSNALVGKWFSDKGDHRRALPFFKLGVALDTEDQLIRIYHVDALIKMARFSEAKTLFETITPSRPHEAILHTRLRAQLENHVEA